MRGLEVGLPLKSRFLRFLPSNTWETRTAGLDGFKATRIVRCTTPDLSQLSRFFFFLWRLTLRMGVTSLTGAAPFATAGPACPANSQRSGRWRWGSGRTESHPAPGSHENAPNSRGSISQSTPHELTPQQRQQATTFRRRQAATAWHPRVETIELLPLSQARYPASSTSRLRHAVARMEVISANRPRDSRTNHSPEQGFAMSSSAAAGAAENRRSTHVLRGAGSSNSGTRGRSASGNRGALIAPPPKALHAGPGSSPPSAPAEESSDAASTPGAKEGASSGAGCPSAALLKEKDEKIAMLERELSVMESEFARELDRLSQNESETATFWQGKHSALNQQFLRADTELRLLRAEVEVRRGEREELRDGWEALRRELREKEEEIAELRGQVRGLKEWVSTSTRSDAQVADEVFGEAMGRLGNELQNWVIVNFRRAKLGECCPRPGVSVHWLIRPRSREGVAGDARGGWAAGAHV